MKRALALVLLLFACRPPDSPSAESTSKAGPGQVQLGGLTLESDGRLTSWVIAATGIELVTDAYRPFVLTRGYNAVHPDRFPADSLVVQSTEPNSAVVRLSASALPEVWIDLEIRAENNAVFFTVLDKFEPDYEWLAIPPDLGLDTRFVPPLHFECQLGYVGWTPGSHTCSSSKGTAGAFCLNGNCDNRTMHRSPAVGTGVLDLGSQLGAWLLPTPIKSLVGSSFALFTSGHAVKSLGFLADFRNFKNIYGSTAESGSQLFLTSPPWVFGAPGPHFTVETAERAAQIAKQLGFNELMLANGAWLNYVGPYQHASHGLFDPHGDIDGIARAIKREGLCPMFHNIPSLLSQHNSLCNGDPNCPAALRNPDGTFVTTDTYWFSDLNQRPIQDHVLNSTADGLVAAGACGMYADGSDWFFSNYFSAPTYIEEFVKRAPSLRLRPNYTMGNSALFTIETETQDVYQIYRHVSTRDWAMQFEYFALQGMLENIGLRGRMGWVPPPRSTDTQEDYQILLNTAVATGSYLTIETYGDDPTLTGAESPWFAPALTHAIGAVDEIRAGKALGFYAGGDARHDLHHFDSGVSTIALFDGIVPASEGSSLEARGFGVQTRTGFECGPFSSCFFFTGAARMMTSHLDAELTERGSYLYHPGAALTDSESFTITAWFKPDGHRPPVGGIFEKGLLGYGMSYYDGGFTGHFSGKNPGDSLGIYHQIYNPRRPEWHHAAFSYSATDRTFRLYLDGAPVQTVPSGLIGNFYASTPIYVGTAGSPYDGANFAGWMNDVRLYPRTVGDAEMVDIYQSAFGNGGVPGEPPLLAWSSGQVVPNVVVDIDLETQRTAYLVPMIEGNTLPAESIRLTFRDIYDVRRATVSADVPAQIVKNRLARTIEVTINSADLPLKPARVAVVQ